MADLFMKFEGGNSEILGDSADPQHLKWIELESVSMPGRSTFGAGRGAAGSAPSPKDVTVSKRPDSASPGLFKAVSTGDVFKSVTIDFWDPGRRASRFSLKLSNAVVSSFSLTGSHGGPAGVENVTLNFQGALAWTQGPPPTPAPNAADNHGTTAISMTLLDQLLGEL